MFIKKLWVCIEFEERFNYQKYECSGSVASYISSPVEVLVILLQFVKHSVMK